jgi:ATP-dependent exoDNAse (exonuclease V) beta subunit
MHGLLEHAMRHRNATREDLRRLATWLTVEEPQLRNVVEEALDTVQAVASERFWADAKASAECHEEAPFAVIDNKGSLRTVLNGVIDLVHRHDSSWRIVDYKTDLASDSAGLAAKYAAQIADYESAWTYFVRDPVSSMLVSTRAEDEA